MRCRVRRDQPMAAEDPWAVDGQAPQIREDDEMTFAMLNTHQPAWTPSEGAAVRAGYLDQLSAATPVLEQTHGFHLLARTMRSRHGDAGRADTERAEEELRQMHEANRASVLKMARWTEATLKKREDPQAQGSSEDIVRDSDARGKPAHGISASDHC